MPWDKVRDDYENGNATKKMPGEKFAQELRPDFDGLNDADKNMFDVSTVLSLAGCTRTRRILYKQSAINFHPVNIMTTLVSRKPDLKILKT